MIKKNVYESPQLQVLVLTTNDVITTSTDWQEQYDDKGAWNPSWFNGNE